MFDTLGADGDDGGVGNYVALFSFFCDFGWPAEVG